MTEIPPAPRRERLSLDGEAPRWLNCLAWLLLAVAVVASLAGIWWVTHLPR